MRVSWNWLSELVDLSKAGTPEKLGEILTSRGLEVEAIERQDQGFEKVVTAKILERAKHPEADRLSLCKVSTGAGDPLDIVCGAQNMKAGDVVALAQVGANLPNGMKISQGKIRGVVSNGMLCSEEELCLKAQSEGILILPESTKLGQPLAQVLGRDDVIMTFKLTANRGDCLSHWGMAREIAAALGVKPKRPEAKALTMGGSPVAVSLEAGDLSPQFWGAYIEGVKVGASPAWLVKKLEAVGSRSINNVVDATNLVLLELGQPVHAYDADLIEGAKLSVRMGREGEELPLLDGKSVTLAGTELVIADGQRAVGLAGVMGGGNSEVRDATTRVFLECAEFSPVHVRRAATKHVRRTDAAMRFEKGIDPAGVPHAIARLASLVIELAGGTVKGAIAATQASREPGKAKFGGEVKVDFGYFEKFLGMKVSPEEAERVLVGLDCSVAKIGDVWTVKTPSYRLDLSRKEDLAEEIARTLGYDKIPSTIPVLTNAPKPLNADADAQRRTLIEKAKDSMMASGLSEALNFAFTSKEWLRKFGLESSAVLVNPLSEEHEALVPSLIPGLVQNAIHSWSHHFGSDSLAIRLFELRPTFHTKEGQKAEAKGEMETTVEERWKLAFALSGPRFEGALRNELGEVDFYDLKAVVDSLLEKLGARGVRVLPFGSGQAKSVLPTAGLFHPGQSVEVLAGPATAGYFGLLHPGKAKQWKMRGSLWVGELDWDALAKLSKSATAPREFKAWSEFPPMERDFALLVKGDVLADKIAQVAVKAGKPIAKTAKIFDVYKGAQVAEGMTSVAVRVTFFGEGKSLTETETEEASQRILDAWKKELGVQLRI